MKIIKRIIALLILVCAIIGWLGMLGGVVGNWVINYTVKQVGVDVLNIGVELAGAALETGTWVETLLLDVQIVGRAIETELEDVDAGSDDSLDGIAALLDTDAAQLVADIDSFFALIERIALALAAVVDTVRNVPVLADESAPVDENIFRSVAVEIDALRSDVDSLIDTVDRGLDDLNEQVIAELNATTAQLNARIRSLLTQIVEINTELITLQPSLLEARTDWTRLVDVISIVVTIVFLFIDLAFLSLALHAWAYFVQPDHSFRSLIPLERRGEGRGRTRHESPAST